MRKFTILLALATAALASSANAGVTINFTGSTAMPSNNDFKVDLSGLGLTRYTTTGASLILDANSVISFELLGTESGYDDHFATISAPNLSYTEHTSFLNSFASPISIGSASFSAGSLLGLLNFSSVGGAPATVGQDGFGIFLGPNQNTGQSFSTFYLGYDDQTTGQDDDHDDMIIRATVRSAVPEPTTWATFLVGFGAAGIALRRSRRKSPALQAS
jgi:hypothetical protein